MYSDLSTPEKSTREMHDWNFKKKKTFKMYYFVYECHIKTEHFCIFT